MFRALLLLRNKTDVKEEISVNTGRSDVKNKIFFSVMFALAFFISCVFVPGIRAGGRYMVCADLLFAMSVVAGILYENRRAVSVIALVSGIVSDVFLTPPMHLSPLLFFFAAYYAAKTVGVFTKTNAATAAVASIPFFLIRSVVGCVYTLSANDGTSLGFVLKNTVLPELAFNVTAVFFTYIAVSFLYKWAKRRFFIL